MITQGSRDWHVAEELGKCSERFRGTPDLAFGCKVSKVDEFSQETQDGNFIIVHQTSSRGPARPLGIQPHVV